MAISFLNSSLNSYINLTKIVGLDNFTVRDVIIDSTYSKPFLYITKTSPDYLYFFDVNQETYITDFNIPITNYPSRVFFDIPSSTVVFDDSSGNLNFYDVIQKTQETVSEYNEVPISNKIDIDCSDTEIAIADIANHRLIIIDKFDRKILRILANSSMRYPYRILCVNDGSFLVRCFNASNISKIYRMSQDGEIIKTFSSFTPFSIVGGYPIVENWYSAHRSSASGMAVFGVSGYEGVIVIKESDNTSDSISLTGYSVSGVYAEDSSEDVFVNTLNSGNNRILRVRKSYGVVGTQKSSCQGMIRGIGDYGNAINLFSNIESGNKTKFIENENNFQAIDNESEPNKLSLSSLSLSSQSSSYKKVGSEVIHLNSRIANADVWHFRHTGIVGSKVSIDRNLAFESFEADSLIKTPVFCFDFEEDEYVDTFFLSDKSVIRKMALFYNKGDLFVEQVKEVSTVNEVSNIFVYEGRLVISEGGYLSLYSYDDMNRISYHYYANDVVASDYRFNYIWACSRSRGKIWKINKDDISDYTEIDAQDAPISLHWSEYFNKYIIHCESSLKFMDYISGAITTFYDVNEYTINKILPINDEIALLLKSNEKVPMASDYDTTEEFEEATRDRNVDKICILYPNKKKYSLEKSLPYNWNTSDVTFNGQEITYLSTDNTKVYIGIVDKDTWAEVRYVYQSSEIPVGIVELPLAGISVAVLSDWSVLDWSSGKVLPIASWVESSSSSSIYGLVSILSNGVIIKRSEVGKQTGSSSSCSSSSSQIGAVKTYTMRVIVGDSPGFSNKWDSGEFTTTEKCILYGGGNNLEPGQTYYVSMRAKGELDVWSPYDTTEFIVPHFNNFTNKSSSSSSSSSNSALLVDTVYYISSGDTANCGVFEKIAIVFHSEYSETANVILGITNLVVKNNSGNPIFGFGSIYEYTFTELGESITFAIGGTDYSVTYVNDSDIVLIIRSGS